MVNGYQLKSCRSQINFCLHQQMTEVLAGFNIYINNSIMCCRFFARLDRAWIILIFDDVKYFEQSHKVPSMRNGFQIW